MVPKDHFAIDLASLPKLSQSDRSGCAFEVYRKVITHMHENGCKSFEFYVFVNDEPDNVQLKKICLRKRAWVLYVQDNDGRWHSVNVVGTYMDGTDELALY